MPEAAVRELSDQVWERILARDPAAARRCGRQVDALPRGGPGELAENVSFAGAMLPKLAGTGGVQAAFLRDHLEHELAEEQRFWLDLGGAVEDAWYFYGMKTAIDSAGRVVIPKALRDALGLTTGQPLEITEQDGRLEIVPAATPMRLVDEGDGVAAIADGDMPVLTTDMVRDTLERIRR